MVQQSNYRLLETEQDFRRIQDEFYALSKEHFENGKVFNFKGLLEIIRSPIVIQTAIHNIKGNKGSKTAGSDGKTIRDVLEKPFHVVIEEIQSQISNYRPKPVRRVWIDKPGKTEKRPLGIPSIEDRIIQECVKIVIEPILEAQFYDHSYGYRPQRDAEQAIARVAHLGHSTKNHWVVEGDISKFFDNVNHRILIKKLWNMGIRDRRVLAIIQEMLKAGIMDECSRNEIGTPQGGIISPLFANVYLNSLDWLVANSWDTKKTRHEYKSKDARNNMLKKHTNLIPVYLIRYADDWVLFTNSKENAILWKNKIDGYLKDTLKIKLSEEKTKITNIRKQPIRFLGFKYRLEQGKSVNGYVSNIRPDEDRLKPKIREILTSIERINGFPTIEGQIHQINIVNQKIRGVIEYYSIATKVSNVMRKYSWILKNKAIYRVVVKRGGELIKANEADNLTSIHSQYSSKLPAIKHKGFKVAVTNLSFCRWERATMKNPEETPYTPLGRHKYRERTLKKPIQAREDSIMSENLSKKILFNKSFLNRRITNFEYFLNRAYAFNRDKGKCKVCKVALDGYNLHSHHINPRLPIEKVNKVGNLASLCDGCHKKVHDGRDHSLTMKQVQWKKITVYREKLGA